MAWQSVPVDLITEFSLSIESNTGDGVRFARLFGEALLQMPLDVRQRIFEYWFKVNNQPVLLELSNLWAKSFYRSGQTENMGFAVKFNASEVDRMPENVVKALVVHELAHVYQYATGRYRRKHFKFEFDADESVTNWGFDLVALRKWK